MSLNGMKMLKFESPNHAGESLVSMRKETVTRGVIASLCTQKQHSLLVIVYS
jgi:hypothetical protein